MKRTRKIIEIDEALCNGCGQCVPSCHEGAIQIVEGKARLVSERYCDGLGACLGECPTGALRIVEREADAFDEAAVQERLAAQAVPAPPVSGCPSTRVLCFDGRLHDAPPSRPAVSALSHWPVQIRLVPPGAPFLQGANLLVAADCVPIAYAGFHADLLPGRAVMMGCPKFDDVQEYIQKFAAIFSQTEIKSVLVAVMQVPCCQGLPVVVQKGMVMSGKKIPGEIVVLSLEGQVLRRKPLFDQ